MIRQFKLGQSNPTFLLIDIDGRRMVIRKKPPGSLLSKTAHAIEREYLAMEKLKRTDVPVPKVYLFCDDVNILGTSFYAMEFLEGRIFSDNLLPTVPMNARRSYYHSIIGALVKLHSVDYKLIGLENYGRQGGYYPRQLDTLFRISQIQAAVKGTDNIPVGELYRLKDIMNWLTRNVVRDEVTLIHGDYKTDNIVFHPNHDQVIGILDWEL